MQWDETPRMHPGRMCAFRGIRMNNRSAAAALVLAALLLAPDAGAQTCPPAGMSRDQLLDLKAHEFALPDDARRQALALDLISCLGSTDQELRDAVAFGALSTWMRGKQLSAATVDAVAPDIAETPCFSTSPNALKVVCVTLDAVKAPLPLMTLAGSNE